MTCPCASPGLVAIGAFATMATACVPEGPPTWREAANDAPLRVVPGAGSAPSAGEDAHRVAPYRDDFERGVLGDDYHALSTAWRLDEGELCAFGGAKNQGVWLRRPLPENARIELDARSESAEGDIKIEVWGDGKTGAKAASYDHATSYLLILGGWQNHRHVLARLDEHGADRLALEVDPASADPRARPVIPGERYRFRVERRDGRTLSWWVNDVLYFELADSAPLAGARHQHLGFNNWTSAVCFDNLVITPLE